MNVQLLTKTTATAPDGAKKIAIPSPISGIAKPLIEVPDILYAESLYGDGVAVELSGTQLIAPFKSKVTLFPATKHKIQLTAANGLQLTIQLGIESEVLMGEGFKSQIKLNDNVARFQPLIHFDYLKLKRKLPSLLSPVIFNNSEKLAAITPHYGRVTAKESAIMTIFI